MPRDAMQAREFCAASSQFTRAPLSRYSRCDAYLCVGSAASGRIRFPVRYKAALPVRARRAAVNNASGRWVGRLLRVGFVGRTRGAGTAQYAQAMRREHTQRLWQRQQQVTKTRSYLSTKTRTQGHGRGQRQRRSIGHNGDKDTTSRRSRRRMCHELLSFHVWSCVEAALGGSIC